MKTFAVLLEERDKRLSDLQIIMIKLWGNTMYLMYDDLPRGKGNQLKLENELITFFDIEKGGDIDEYIELLDWLEEGASVNGKPLLTRELYDTLLQSAATTITEELTIYKSGMNGEIKPINRWASWTTIANNYKEIGEERKVTLSPGAKVVFTNGHADKGEVIIMLSEVAKYAKN